MVIVGASGTGKTNLMIRLWAGWLAAMLVAGGRSRPRPLLVALDCKGGPDARAKPTVPARCCAAPARDASPYGPTMPP